MEGANGPIQADGTVLIHVIRPTVGRGRGNHLYEADMLEKHAPIFGGWKMYTNHLSPEARKAAAGLPRDVQDLGGRIVESWWDGTVPPQGRFGRGAVVAKVKPTPFIRELIENDPEIVEASISATATAVRPGMKDGKKVWVVEGIADRGSVDWVTEAGAGGRVVSLLEAAMQEHTAADSMSSLDDDEFMAHLRAERPLLAEALAGSAGAPESTQEDNMGQIDPEVLTEALQSDEAVALIEQIVETKLSEGLAEAARPLVEAALAEERDLIRAEARADADRRISLRDMRDEAHRLISEAATKSRWPETLVADAKGKFDLTESGEPTPALDVIDVIDGEGNVSKSARKVLTEAVAVEIDRQGTLLASVRPTRVRAQGPKAAGEESEAAKSQDTLHSAVLQEGGIAIDESTWANV